MGRSIDGEWVTEAEIVRRRAAAEAEREAAAQRRLEYWSQAEPPLKEIWAADAAREARLEQYEKNVREAGERARNRAKIKEALMRARIAEEVNDRNARARERQARTARSAPCYNQAASSTPSRTPNSVRAFVNPSAKDVKTLVARAAPGLSAPAAAEVESRLRRAKPGDVIERDGVKFSITEDGGIRIQRRRVR